MLSEGLQCVCVCVCGLPDLFRGLHDGESLGTQTKDIISG